MTAEGSRCEVETEEKYGSNQGLLMLAQCDDERVAMEATEKLIEKNMGLVKSIAVRFRGRCTEYEDLVQIGTMGMLKAIRSFDADKGCVFSTYAVPLIAGEIRRHLRDDGIIKIGRGQRKLGMDLRAAEARIMNEEGREAHVEELAALCGVTSEEAAIALEATTPVISFSYSALGEEGTELGNSIADASDLEEMDMLRDKIALSQAITRLDPVWRKILILRYYRNMTQQQTAVMLGLSQVKVSREEKKILSHLRQILV